MFIISVFVIYAILCIPGVTGNRTHVENLYSSLLTDYNKYVRPDDNQSEATSVWGQMYLISINDLDEVSGTLSTVVYLKMIWKEPRMIWDRNLYGNVAYIFIPQTQLWKPDMGLANPVNRIRQLGLDEVMVKVSYDGRAEWEVGDFIQASCNFDATHFPFDQQSCDIIFKPLSYTKTDLVTKITFNSVDLTYYSENGEWRMIGSRAESIELGTFSVMKFTLNIERRSEFFIVSIFTPFIVLVSLNCMVFLLPSDSGERIGYSITCLLAIAVFLTLISDNLPNTSKPISVLAYIIMFCLLLSTTICILTIFSLLLHHKNDSKPVPKILKSFVRLFNSEHSCTQKKSKVITVSPTDCENRLNRMTDEKNAVKSYSPKINIGDESRKSSPDSMWSKEAVVGKRTSDMDHIKLSVTSRKKNSEPKHGKHLDRKLEKLDKESPPAEVKWKDFAEVFDKICFAVVLGCTILLGAVYFMISSGRL